MNYHNYTPHKPSSSSPSLARAGHTPNDKFVECKDNYFTITSSKKYIFLASFTKIGR